MNPTLMICLTVAGTVLLVLAFLFGVWIGLGWKEGTHQAQIKGLQTDNLGLSKTVEELKLELAAADAGKRRRPAPPGEN